MKFFLPFIFFPLIIFGQNQRNKVHQVYKDKKTSTIALHFYSCNYDQELRKKRIAPSIIKQLPEGVTIGCRKPSDYFITKKINEDKYQFCVRNDTHNIWLSYHIKLGKENGKYYIKPDKIALVNDNKVFKPWGPDLVESFTDDEFIRLVSKTNSDYLNEAIKTISSQIGRPYILSKETEDYIAEVFNKNYEPGENQVKDLVNDSGSELIRIYFETLNNPNIQKTNLIAPSVLNQMPEIFKLYRFKKPTTIYITSKDTTNAYMIYRQNEFGNYVGNHIILAEENGNLYIKPVRIDISNYESLYPWDPVLLNFHEKEEFLARLKTNRFSDDKYTSNPTTTIKKKKSEPRKFTDINLFARTSEPQGKWAGDNKKEYSSNDWLSPYEKEQLKKAWDSYRNSRSVSNGVCPACGGTGKVYTSQPKEVKDSKITNETDYSYTVETTTRKMNWYRQHKCSSCNGGG